jgi:hypothetical protein
LSGWLIIPGEIHQNIDIFSRKNRSIHTIGTPRGNLGNSRKLDQGRGLASTNEVLVKSVYGVHLPYLQACVVVTARVSRCDGVPGERKANGVA